MSHLCIAIVFALLVIGARADAAHHARERRLLLRAALAALVVPSAQRLLRLSVRVR